MTTVTEITTQMNVIDFFRTEFFWFTKQKVRGKKNRISAVDSIPHTTEYIYIYIDLFAMLMQ